MDLLVINNQFLGTKNEHASFNVRSAFEIPTYIQGQA